MLTRRVPQAETLWEEFLPVEAHKASDDLARVNALLWPTADHWQRK
jgi:hypothetical protein